MTQPILGDEVPAPGSEAALQHVRAALEEYWRLNGALDEGVLLLDAAGQVLTSNPAAWEMLGLSAEQLRGEQAVEAGWRVVGEDGADIEWSRLPQLVALRTGQAFRRLVLGVARPSAPAAWFSASAQPLMHEAHGAPFGAICSFIDISDLKRAEEALRVSEDRFRAMVETSPDSIAIIGMDWDFQQVNPAFRNSMGYTGDELVGPQAFKLIHPEDLPMVGERLNYALTEAGRGELVATTFRLKHSKGHWGFLDAHGTPLIDDSGKRKGALVVFRDISRQKRAESELQASEQKYRSLVENSMEGVFQTTPEGQVLTANPALVHMLGFASEAELRAWGPTGGLYANPEDRDRLTQRLDADGEVRNVEVVLRRRDGGLLTVRENARVVRGPGGEVLYYEGTLSDVTERRQAFDELRRQEALIAAVAASAARLLSDPDFSAAMQHALGVLGRAADVDRAYVFEWHQHSRTREPAASQRFEWTRDPSLAVMDDPLMQDLPLGEAGLGRWYEVLSGGGIIAGLVRELPGLERPLLESQDIRSILCVPISAGEAAGGFVGFDDCRTERVWTANEQAALAAAAGSIGAALQRKQVHEALRASEESYRELFQNANDIVYTTDLQGTFTSANRVGELITGYPIAELLGMNISRIVSPEHLEVARRMTATKVAGETQRTTYEIEIVTQDGRRVPVEVSSRLIYENGRPAGVQGIARDITERKAAEGLFQMVANSSPVGVFILQDGVFRFVNPTFERLTGYSSAELVGTEPLDLVLPEDRANVRANATAMLRGERGQAYEYRSRSKAGEILWIFETVAPITYRGERAVLGNYIDITERKRIERQLEYQAHYDALTGLPNRHYFIERLEESVTRAEERSENLAVLFLDLDGFKAVNDRFGHAGGDELLAAAAERLVACLRPRDVVARMGGDEFTILLQSLERREDATRVAQRIVDALRQPFRLSGFEAHATVSVGLSFSQAGSYRAGDLLRQADIALYNAKAAGKARYAIFGDETPARAA